MRLMKLVICLIATCGTVYAQPANKSGTGTNTALPVIAETAFKKDTFNIVAYGATRDGIHLNTEAINNAIRACNEKGGGVVLVPEGLWLTGPIVLKSNVNLHLRKNALLQFTGDFDQYPLVEGIWEGVPQMRNQSPVSASGAKNIAITGAGIIDGSGEHWRMVKKEKLTDAQWKKLIASGGALSADKKIWYPSAKSLYGSTLDNPGVIVPGKNKSDYEAVKDFLRPNLVVLTGCDRVLLEGVTFQNSPAWNLHPLMTTNLTVRNVYVKNPWYAQNGDGIDVESCSGVLIENSTFDVGDDAICIKSGKDEAGRKRAMPTENVIVKNCTVYHAHGGFVIGSEMSGGARNIYVNDCTFIGTDIGLRFKTTRGRGGIVENIFIKNIAMKDMVGEAILFDMYYAAKDPVPLPGEKVEPVKVQTLPVTEATPQFRNFHISDVVCTGAGKGIFVRGIPEMNVKNIVLENMVIQANKGVELNEASSIELNNIRLVTKDKEAVFSIHNSQHINIKKLNYSPERDVVFNVTGNKSKDIRVTANDANKNMKPAATFEFGADSSALSSSPDLSLSKPTALSMSERMAATVMTIWKDSMVIEGKPVKWAYDQGVVLKGIEGLWLRTGDGRYFDYIKKSMDFFVNEDGTIRTYKLENYNIDNLLCGRNLLMLYNVLGKEKYYKAAATLRQQLRTHPRTREAGFWHKQIYPWQMWLDGLYMAQPFYTEWAVNAGEDTAFNDIARQFILMEKYARDPKTGLLYHGYDESREQLWANKTTGRSPHVWARAMGWFGMALVDVLEQFPQAHPQRATLKQMLNRFATAVTRYQDKQTGLWYDIMDMPGKDKNYVEASASSMLVYTLAKAVRLNLLNEEFSIAAKRGYEGILKTFIREENNQLNLHGTVSVSGLGGKPYRDGSFDYYMSEKVVVNDPKGVGAFLMASNEISLIPLRENRKKKKVVLDYYFNNETKKDINGRNIRFHYIWNEMDNNGFSLLGELFRWRGAHTDSLATAPTSSNLKNADVYIIVDADTEKETSNPNYIQSAHITAISDWVKAGGTLMLMANDSLNAEFKHFNLLAEKFGIRFNGDSKNKVKGNEFQQGEVVVPSNHPILKNASRLYVKELSTMSVKAPAAVVLRKGDDNIIATANYGKGRVIAIGDPWLYNEYIDGRKLPKDFDNYTAANDLVDWLLAK